MKVKRFDIFRADVAKLIKTDAGFLKVPIRATRVGVFKYYRPDGSVRLEFRPAEEVFNEDSMASIANVPLTIQHPTEMVTSMNVGNHSVGMTGETVVKTDEMFLDVPGILTKDRAVKMVEKKRDRGESQEVSCGYTCDMEETPGVFQGEKYDVIQRNIKYNHVALVDKGRAGAAVKLRLDSDSAIIENDLFSLEVETMKKFKIDGKEFEADEKLVEAFEAFQTKKTDEFKKIQTETDSLTEEVKELTKEKDQIEARRDSLKDENKTLKKDLETKKDAEQIDKLIEERQSVIEVAEKHIKDFKKDKKSVLEIKKEVIKAKNPDIKLDEKSDDYIEARFDAISELPLSEEDKLAVALKRKAKKDANDENEEEVDSNEARKKFVKDSSEEWKQSLAISSDKA